MEEQDKNLLSKSARRRLRAKKLQEKYKSVDSENTGTSKLSLASSTDREDSKTPDLKEVKKRKQRRRKKIVQETSSDDVNELLDRLSKSLGQDLITDHKSQQTERADGSVTTKIKNKPNKKEESHVKGVTIKDLNLTPNPVVTTSRIGDQQCPSVTVTPSKCIVTEIESTYSDTRSALIKEANDTLRLNRHGNLDGSVNSSDEEKDYSDDEDSNPDVIDFPGLQESFAHIRKLLDAQKVLPESVEAATATSTPVVHELLAKCEKVAWDVGALVNGKGKEDHKPAFGDIDITDKVRSNIASYINQKNLKNITRESHFGALAEVDDFHNCESSVREKDASELVTVFDSGVIAALPDNNDTEREVPNTQRPKSVIVTDTNHFCESPLVEKEIEYKHSLKEGSSLQTKKDTLVENKMESSKKKKTKEEIKAEREAKKLAKQAAKQGKKVTEPLAPSSGGASNVKAVEKVAQSEQQPKQPKSAKENAPEVDKKSVAAKSKAELKAERRALQEKQRAAKVGAAATTGEKPVSTGAPKPSTKQQASLQQPKTSLTISSSGKQAQRVPDDVQADSPSVEKKLARRLERQQLPQRTRAQRKVLLFNHLHQYEREISLTRDLLINSTKLHPAIVTLGVQYAEGVVVGSNARCVALLCALKQLILDYETPPQKELSRDLEVQLQPAILYLKQCRPLGVSMGNAIRFLKYQLTQMSQNQEKIPDTKAKKKLTKSIDDYINEKIFLADKAISITAREKINNGDVILVYACSSLLRRILVDAHHEGKQFRVMVVDGRPRSEGREMVRALAAQGLECYYVLITAASYIMPEVSKVFLGAHALLANGYVMSRAGSSQVALIARAHNVPVLVCCETYKFCERVQTDSFVFNELGDPDDLVRTHLPSTPLGDWRDIKWLTLLNLTYDVTPPDLVTAVITELAILPCTSVPVVLRVKHSESNMWEYT